MRTEQKDRLAAVSPRLEFIFDHAANAAAFFLLRHPNNPNALKPVAKSGSAAGSGVAEMVPSPPRKLHDKPGGQLTPSTALIDSNAAPTKSDPEFNVSVRTKLAVVSRKLTSVEVMLDPAVLLYCAPGSIAPAVVKMLTDNSDDAVVSTLKKPLALPPSPKTGTETSHVIVAALAGLTCVSVSDAPTAAIASKVLNVITYPRNRTPRPKYLHFPFSSPMASLMSALPPKSDMCSARS